MKNSYRLVIIPVIVLVFIVAVVFALGSNSVQPANTNGSVHQLALLDATTWKPFESALGDFAFRIPTGWSSVSDVRGSNTSLKGSPISEGSHDEMLDVAVWYEQLPENVQLQEFAKRSVLSPEDILQEQSLMIDGHAAFRTLVRTPSTAGKAVVQYAILRTRSVIMMSTEVSVQDVQPPLYESAAIKTVNTLASTFRFLSSPEAFTVTTITDGSTVVTDWQRGFRLTIPNGWNVTQDTSNTSMSTMTPPAGSTIGFSMTAQGTADQQPNALSRERDAAQAAGADTVTIESQNEVIARSATEQYAGSVVTTFLEDGPLLLKVTAQSLDSTIKSKMSDYHDILSQLLVL